MSEPRQQTCIRTGKRAFPSKHRAHVAREALERGRHRVGNLGVYRCRHCEHFHLFTLRSDNA
jgi:hypothetical protein